VPNAHGEGMPVARGPSTPPPVRPYPETYIPGGTMAALSYDVEVTDAGTTRVGHEERERLVHVLMQQYAEGRLTAAELDDLSGRARQARTYADLDRLVVDLPVAPPSAALHQSATTANLARLGTDPDHRQTLSGGMSSYVRRGVWTVPAYLNLNAGMATVKLDFQQAICPHEVVDISVSAGVGSVVLVVPEGWGVNTDQVGKGIGSVSNKVDTIAQPGKPMLVLHGNSVAGSVKIRYPGRHDRYMMRRNLKRGGVHTQSGGTTGRPAVPSAPLATPRPATPRPATPQDAPPQDQPLQ